MKNSDDDPSSGSAGKHYFQTPLEMEMLFAGDFRRNLRRMEEKLKRLNEELDKKIDDKCGELLEEAEQKKRLSRDWDRLEKDLAEALS